MDQQFSLSWNNFHGNFTKGFAGLLGNGEFADVTIAVDSHLLQAHKVILSICSPYFKKIFQLNPCQHPIVVLRDVSHSVMKDLLQFMYHGEVSVKREDLTSFIGTAEFFQIKVLTDKETEEDINRERDQDLPNHRTETQNNTPVESCGSHKYDTGMNDETTQNNELELQKQRQLIEKLQRLGNLKRKSDFSDILNPEKRPKTKEKSIYTQNNQIYQTNNYENLKRLYDENPVNVTSTFNTHLQKINTQDFNGKSKDQSLSDNGVELKTECDDSGIFVTDPAACSNPKSYELSREGKQDLSIPIDYLCPQDNILNEARKASEDSEYESTNKIPLGNVDPLNFENYDDDNNPYSVHAKLNQCFKLLGMLMVDMKDLKERTTVNNYGNTCETNIETALQIKKDLPLKSRAEVNAFEEKLLNSQDYRQQFVRIVSQIGGANGKDYTERVLNTIFSPSFASDNTWEGKMTKYKVNKLKLINICEEVILKKFNTWDSAEFSKTGTNWFRLGKQRAGQQPKQVQKKTKSSNNGNTEQ